MKCYTGPKAKKEIIGLRFGRLLVMSELKDRNKNGHIVYLCQCDCGKTKEILGSSLRSGKSTSCCYFNNNKNKQSNSDEYKIWLSMKNRCLNPNNKKYPNYGGRGISVCDRWLESSDNFLSDMGKKPSKEYSIDRIDVNGNYEPSNCRWATAKDQARNRTNNRLYNIDGVSKTVSEWSEILKIPLSTIYNRLNRNSNINGTFVKD